MGIYGLFMFVRVKLHLHFSFYYFSVFFLVERAFWDF